MEQCHKGPGCLTESNASKTTQTHLGSRGATGTNFPANRKQTATRLINKHLLLLYRNPLQDHKLELYRKYTYVHL